MSFEHLFASSVLNVLVPDTTVQFPPNGPLDDWLAHLQSGSVDRRQAFFDEQLQSFLSLRIEHPMSDTPADPNQPPHVLLAFLAHIQVALEATYISSAPNPVPDVLRTSKLGAPPRSALASKAGGGSKLHVHHPSILPPATPNPTPQSAEHDKRYAASEGTLLLASIWGQNADEDSKESFALLWSDKEQIWVAVYRLAFTVSFLRLNVSDPLLCITISVTLRERPLKLIQQRHPLVAYLAKIGGQQLLAPESPGTDSFPKEELEEGALQGLEEVNLLQGLFAGPTFANDDEGRINLPTIRLGTVSRQKLFSLGPVSLPPLTAVTPSPMTAIRTAHPTLRKSYRKTLQTVSGFRVRMRTVFVPYVLLPDHDGSLDKDFAETEQEKREAGNEERTVVLCVEIDNAGDSGPSVGFLVDKVEVTISGEGAKAILLGWGDGCFKHDAENRVFPLRIGSMAQYNLLYAVSFLRAPEEVEGFSLSRDSNSGAGSELQRAVSINIFGRPYTSGSSIDVDAQPLFPTQPFSSKWNCVLDLSAHQSMPLDDDMAGMRQALPEPASPFPASSTPRTPGPSSLASAMFASGFTPQTSAIAGSKRHTLPGSSFVAVRSIKGSTPNRASIPMINVSNTPSPYSTREQPPLPGYNSPRTSYIPPSLATQMPRSPTTYGAPVPPQSQEISHPNGNGSPGAYDEQQQPLPPPPMTPAYPAYPPFSAAPPTPMSQGPIASLTTGNVGPMVEIRRERGNAMGSTPVPQTPGPWVPGASGEQETYTSLRNAEDSGESVVVSVGLLPLPGRRSGSGKDTVLGPGKIYPLDYFTLDIFVFNQSEWTRRFEITCPDMERRRRKRDQMQQQQYGDASVSAKLGIPGIMPMDARVRIGPLRPSACQSVRMDFLALTPGVHSIDALTLTDIETGFSINLRSVMDVVVHEPANS